MSNKKQHDEEHSKIYKVWLWIKQWWLPIAILLITSIGLACALSIPQRVFETPREPANDKSAPVLLAQSNLRLAFLYITGGAIAVMGLVETFRKNNNEKLKNDQEKQKNDREHLRQVRADRRERYTKAVEQLGDEKAPIRMGGVYTLVGLIDEWLEDESIEKYEDRLKEGKVIINNLCAYIRSPFTLASHYNELSNPTPTPKGIYKDKKEKFYADKATLDSEADVRLSIIKEIHDRIQGPDKNTPGAWSDFEYDFSGSTFFYPIDLTNSYYTKPINFSGSTYQGGAYFSGSTYHGRADFGGSTYQGEANFTGSTYQSRAYFSGSTYQDWTNFSNSIYESSADFSSSTYEKDAIFSAPFRSSTYRGQANFSNSIYWGQANFSNSTYEGEANFSNSTYEGEANFRGSTYEGEANFSDSTYKKDVTFSTPIFRSTYVGKADFRGSTYQGGAYFTGSTYKGGAYFTGSTYKGGAYFGGSTYKGWANFTGSTYQDVADFSRSTYKGGAYFTGSTYKDVADFSRSTYKSWTDFTGSTYQDEADFGGSTYKSEADFSGSLFCSEIYFGYSKYHDISSRFTGCAPQFYNEKNCKNTLFGSTNNDFTVDNNKGYPIDLTPEGIPLKCKFLTLEQKEHIEGKFQEIEKINNKLLEVKDPKEKEELLKKLRSLNEELHKWREEVTTVKVEDSAIESTES